MLPVSQGPHAVSALDRPANHTRSKERLPREKKVAQAAFTFVFSNTPIKPRHTPAYDRVVGNIQYGCYKAFSGLSTVCMYSVFPAFIASYYLAQVANYFEDRAKAHFSIRI